MGNWHRAWITGTCAEAEVEPLRDAINCDYRNEDSLGDKFGALAFTGGLAGVGMWPAKVINAVGNTGERNMGAASIARHLEKLVKVAPSLKVKVHVGGDRETSVCVATVHCEGEKISVQGPEIPELPEISETQLAGNLFKSLQQRAQPISKESAEARRVFAKLVELATTAKEIYGLLPQYIETLEHFETTGPMFHTQAWMRNADRIEALKEVAKSALLFAELTEKYADHLKEKVGPL
jgi:hypothetical protein